MRLLDLLKAKASRTEKTRDRRKPGPRVKLGIESLEGKKLLTTLSPTTFSDPPIDPTNDHQPGGFSLREAVLKANATSGKDTIQLKAGAYSLGTVQSLHGDRTGALEVNDNLEIIGAANGLSELRSVRVPDPFSGTYRQDRVIETSAGVDLTLTGLRLTGGNSHYSADFPGKGGAIYNAGNLTVVGSVISGNRARYGGGIYNTGDLVVTGSAMQANTASRAGGGIYNFNGDSVIIVGSVINRNHGGTYGGGIYNFTTTGSTLVHTSVIAGNSARYGGGVYNTDWGSGHMVVYHPYLPNGGVYGNDAYRSSDDNFAGSAVVVF